jgi:hypothetical protein
VQIRIKIDGYGLFRRATRKDYGSKIVDTFECCDELGFATDCVNDRQGALTGTNHQPIAELLAQAIGKCAIADHLDGANAGWKQSQDLGNLHSCVHTLLTISVRPLATER